MPKPLFHPEVLRQQVRAFKLHERAGDWQPKLQKWASLITSGRADDFKESALLPDFLTDIFCGLLGYTGPLGPSDPHNSYKSHNSHLSTTVPAASANTFTLSRERHVEVDGKVADAVLGRFQKGNEQFVAVLEDKGARDPLDRPLAGRRMRTDLEACLPILRFPAPPPAAGTDDAPARATVRRGSTSRPPLVASWIPSKRTLLQSRQFDRPRSVPLGRVAITSLRSKRTWPTVR